jgi:hypothetical protein
LRVRLYNVCLEARSDVVVVGGGGGCGADAGVDAGGAGAVRMTMILDCW